MEYQQYYVPAAIAILKDSMAQDPHLEVQGLEQTGLPLATEAATSYPRVQATWVCLNICVNGLLGVHLFLHGADKFMPVPADPRLDKTDGFFLALFVKENASQSPTDC